jgi:hypothetical protein
MTALQRRIKATIEADPSPTGPAWTWYNSIAATVGCTAQSVFNRHRALGFRPAIAEPTICRECGRAMVIHNLGYCLDCCRAFGRLGVR